MDTTKSHPPIVPGLGPTIAAIRKERGLSQTALAKAIGVSQSAIGNWEMEVTNLTLPGLVKVAEHFGMRPSALLRRAERAAKKEAEPVA